MKPTKPRKGFCFGYNIIYIVMSNNAASLGQLSQVFAGLISSLLGLVGIVVIIMIAASGLNLLMAGGDKEAAARARNMLNYSILGLVVTLSAWLILNVIGGFL